MSDQPIFITSDGVIVDGELVPFEEFDFSECPVVAELLGIILEDYNGD